MRAVSMTAKKKIFGFVAGVSVVALAVTGANGLAAIAAPLDVSEGQGKFLDGSVGNIDLDTLITLANAYAETPSGNPSEDVPLDVTALNSVNVALGAVNLLGNNGILQLGAVEQFAQADPNGDAYAGSGAVSDSSGAIAIDDAPGEDLADASLNATPLLTGLGLGAVIDELSLEIGALASRAEEVQTVVDSEYLIAGLDLEAHSDAVEGIYDTLDGLLAALDVSDLTAALNEIIAADLGLTLGPLASIGLTSNVGVVLPTLGDLLPSGPIANSTGSVSIDLENGTVNVDFEQLLADEGLDINNLAPNTELIDGAVLTALTTALTSAVTEIVQSALDGVVDNIELNGSLTLDISVAALPIASLALDVSGPLSAPQVDIDTSGLLPGVLATVLTALGLPGVDDLATIVENLLAGVFSGSVVDTLETTVQDLIGVLDIDNLLGGLANALSTVLQLTANVQPTSAPISAPTGDLPGGSFTVRALQITLLPGVLAGIPSLAQVQLASSTVRGTIAAVDADDQAGSDGVDGPDTDGPDTEADTDVDADVDSTDADSGDGSLASTGSTFDGIWLAGLGVLALLAGAAMYLTRRRSMES